MAHDRRGHSHDEGNQTISGMGKSEPTWSEDDTTDDDSGDTSDDDDDTGSDSTDNHDTQSSPTPAMEWEVGRCAVHLLKDNLPKLRRKWPMKTGGHYKKFKSDIHRLQLFPPPYFQKAWTAVKNRWYRRGEKTFLDRFETSMVNSDNSGGWMIGLFAIGLPNHNNALEQNNRIFRQELKEALDLLRLDDRDSDPDITFQSKLPTSLVSLLRAVFNKLLPLWSLKAKGEVFEQVPEPTPDDRVSAVNLANSDNLLKLSDGVYCLRQKRAHGGSRSLTSRMAKRATRLWNQNKWSYSDVKLMSSETYHRECLLPLSPVWYQGVLLPPDGGTRTRGGASFGRHGSVSPSATCPSG
jgi:hypothetical protein